MTGELLEQVLSSTERAVSMADEMINTNTNNRWGRVII